VKHDDEKGSDPGRVRKLVESYGANPDRWPEEERRARPTLEAKDGDPAWLTEQREVDAWLDRAENIAPTADLLRKVAEIPVRHPASTRWSPWRYLRSILVVGTAAATLGLVVGVTTPEPSTTDEIAADEDDLSTLAFGVDLSEDLLP
jgi:hypothetical protein